MSRVGKIKMIKFVPRIGKIISLELLAKRKGSKHGSKSQNEAHLGQK